jgi:group I intron endonuclease
MTIISGIYLIINLLDGKLYVGSAANILSRIGWHKRYLMLGKHHSILLQRAYDKYGPNAFQFAIVEQVKDLKELLNIEQLWLDASQSYDPKFGYNIFRTAGSPRGYRHTEEWKLATSIRQTGKKHSEDVKARMTAAQRNRSEEHKANHLAAVSKPRVFSEEHKRKLKEANARRGNYMTDEIRNKISLAQKERARREGRNVL